MYFLSQPKEDVFIKHATFIHRLKKFHIMCKRFNSNTKNMMICNSLLSKKVRNTPIHSRLRDIYFILCFIICSEVPSIAYSPVAINYRIKPINCNEIR